MSDTKTILIVDDCESDRLLCRRYIQDDPDINYLILEAETVKQAIDLWRSRKPDVVLIDFNLTDGNGLEFLGAIKSNNNSEGLADTKLPVIMLTGNGDERVAVSAMKLGAFDYLVKNDITEFSLRQSIHSLLDRLSLSSKLKRSQTRESLVSQIALNIRQFVNLEDICQAIAQEIRKFLKADRTIIYKFNDDRSRRIISEALIPHWSSCFNFIAEENCPKLSDSQIKQYKEGKVLIASDIHAANFTECHVQMLERLQVRANVVVPILLSKPIYNALEHNFNTNDPNLWGLLIVHQCSAPRIWEDGEIQLLKQLSVHVAIAIQQAEIYQNLQNINLSLEQQVQERTADLQANEQKLRSILNAIPDIINLIDGNGIYLESNRSNAFFNLIPADVDPIGKHIMELLPVEIALDQMQAIQQAISTREIQTLTQTFWVKDCLRYQETRVAPIQENLVTVVVRDISDRKYAEIDLQHEHQRTKLLAEVTLKVRQSLNLEEILKTTVDEIKKILQADRVLILKLHDDGSANVLQEAVTENFQSLLAQQIDKPSFYEEYCLQDRLNQLIKIDNVDTDNISEAHANFLRQFDIKSNLTIPIIESENLWGLLIIDQCDRPRQWTDPDIELLQQLANQLTIAITQSQLVIALQKSEEQRRLAIDLNNIGYWDFDVTTGQVDWNENHFKLLGLDSAEAKSSYLAWQDRVHPDDLERVEKDFNQAMENHTFFEMEYRVVHPQGDIHWVLGKGKGLYDHAGNPKRMIGVIFDISDRKHIELALERELLRNKTLVNTSFDGIFTLDNKGHVIEANLSFATMLGYTPQEITQLSIYDIDIKYTREELTTGIQEFNIGKRAKFETRHRRKDGSICHVEISANSVEWDDDISQFCICRDITQRNQAEEALRQRVQRERMLNQFIQTIRNSLDLKVVFDVATQAIANLLNLDQTVIFKYRAERKVWKYMAVFRGDLETFADIPDECNSLAEKLKRMETVQINDTDQIEDEINRNLAQNESGAWLLVPIIVNNQVWGSLSLRKSHKVAAWEDYEIELTQTISNQLAIAIQQVTLYQQLQLELEERQQTEIKLAQAKESAEAANKAKSSFLAMMSHEIRTPMNGVIGMAELLANTPLEEDQKNFVQIILDSGELLLNVINDILDFSKIESGNLQLETKEFNFTDIINSTCKLLSKQAFDKNINLQCHLNQDLPTTVIGDSSRLRQIFINLIGNAIKFTEQGFIAVTVSGRWITSNTYDFRFSISDTGLGIKSDQIGKLFKPFTQADASINRQFGGTGLGLAICKRLVELMQGSLWVESGGHVGGNPPLDWVAGDSHNNSQGSTFHFAIALPVVSAKQTIKQIDSLIPIEPDIDFKQFPIKILVVEDNLFNQKIIQLILQRLGYETDVAENGQESLTVLSNQESGQEYDLIFMDIQMPVMDGITATKIIRENQSSQTKPWIIALTANVLPEDQQACIDAGMNDYVTKPVNIKQIVRSLSEYIRANELVHKVTRTRF